MRGKCSQQLSGAVNCEFLSSGGGGSSQQDPRFRLPPCSLEPAKFDFCFYIYMRGVKKITKTRFWRWLLTKAAFESGRVQAAAAAEAMS